MKRPISITLIALFFLFGTVMSGLAAFLLLVPGSPLEPLWRLNPQAKEGFAGIGMWAVLLMLVVCAACATAAVGLWRLRRWGLGLAVAILSINIMGDTANTFVLHNYRALIGVPIGGLMIFYLLRRRSVFG